MSAARQVSRAFWQTKLLAAVRGWRWRTHEELVTRTGYHPRHVARVLAPLVAARVVEVSKAKEQPPRYRARRGGSR